MSEIFMEGGASEFMRKYGLKAVAVTSVERSGEEEVFDVSVPGLGSDLPSSFIANGLTVHNSGSPDYIENIFEISGNKKKISDVFGVRDSKTGKYIVKPMIRYRTESTAEPFFDWLSALLRKLPDKKKLGGQWYYIYPYKDRNTGKVNKENVKIVGNLYDKAYFKKTGMFRIPAQDGSLQALVLLDSYPAMLPGVQDVDDPNDALAEQARMFSKQLRRVKGRMKGKRVAVIGINILRQVPMAMYGPSEIEACGTALKQFSDVRVKHTSRALSGVPYLTTEMKRDGKGSILTEKSVTVKGGKDSYRFIHIRADKNKLSRPYMEAWLRLWISDGEMKARGFDPVWDTWVYLKETGQLTGKPTKCTVKFEGRDATKSMDWLTFKLWILGNNAQKREVCEKIGIKAFDVRKACFKQMEAGKGIELFNNHLLDGNKEESEDGPMEVDSDDV